MEQFGELQWSWRKYDEEKEKLLRNFTFDIIHESDALARNLNEIHTCVLPQQHNYRLFKTPEEIAANSIGTEAASKIIDLKDPRRQKYYKFELSCALIKNYSYSSELKRREHLKILGTLKNSTIYNLKFIKSKSIDKIVLNNEFPKKVEEKWQKEVDHFQKCSEIYYHRHITDFNDAISDDLQELLISKWKKLELQLPNSNYQAITMILRNSNTKYTSAVSTSHVDKIPNDFKRKFYALEGERLFESLPNVSIESLKLFLQSKDIYAHKSESTQKTDVQISLDILTKLFVDGTEFNTLFENKENGTKFVFNEAVPLKKISQNDAQGEALKLILSFNIEWHNASKCVTTSTSKNIDYKLRSINEIMSMIFKNYKGHAGANNEINLWKLERDSEKLLISVFSSDCYFMDNTRIIITIKLEYQTTFGAEEMLKDELLKEWIQIKFIKDTCILRFRIDAKSLVILSATKLTIEDIAKELKDLYNCDPEEALNILFNVFHCIRNLPDDSYLIQAQRNENDCNKLLIYKKAFENGRNVINDADFEISKTFTRKWIKIDRKFCTFIHFNEEIAPCCFSYKIPKMSYIMPKKATNAKTTAIDPKSKVIKKRTRQKKKPAKITVTNNLK